MKGPWERQVGPFWGRLQAQSSVQDKASEMMVILSASHLIPAPSWAVGPAVRTVTATLQMGEIEAQWDAKITRAKVCRLV